MGWGGEAAALHHIYTLTRLPLYRDLNLSALTRQYQGLRGFRGSKPTRLEEAWGKGKAPRV